MIQQKNDTNESAEKQHDDGTKVAALRADSDDVKRTKKHNKQYKRHLMTLCSKLQDNLDDILKCQAASTDPDIMYLHEAQKEKDWPEFKKAMRRMSSLTDVLLSPSK